MAPPIALDRGATGMTGSNGAPPLELRARPAGSASSLVVDVSSLDRSPARLELFTVAGRRIASREIAELGPEGRIVDLAAPRELAPGVYLVRLIAAGRSLSVKAVVMR
jgi:hypothetical protein